MFNNKKTQKGQKSEEKCRKKKQEKFEKKKKKCNLYFKTACTRLGKSYLE